VTNRTPNNRIGSLPCTETQSGSEFNRLRGVVKVVFCRMSRPTISLINLREAGDPATEKFAVQNSIRQNHPDEAQYPRAFEHPGTAELPRCPFDGRALAPVKHRQPVQHHPFCGKTVSPTSTHRIACRLLRPVKSDTGKAQAPFVLPRLPQDDDTFRLWNFSAVSHALSNASWNPDVNDS
jgi:hypothetical protein